MDCVEYGEKSSSKNLNFCPRPPTSGNFYRPPIFSLPLW